MTPPLKIAVIGSGISGLSAAWLLSQRHTVTLYERDDRLGGHSHTIDVPGDDSVPIPVDTGFIVYNTATYPNLIALFDHIGVATAPTKMSFSVSLDQGSYEYSGTGLSGLFGQPSNLVNRNHLRMIADLLRFYREAPRLLEGSDDHGTLGDYLAAHHYSDTFVERHILPMAAAIWSTPSADVMAFPVASFVRFFANHDLLQVARRSPWRTVQGGSREYVQRLLAASNGKVELSVGVAGIKRDASGVMVHTNAGGRRFDACVVATHADQALSLLCDADQQERRMLGAFRYQANRAVVHSDARLMPKRRRLWSSWNYLAAQAGPGPVLSLTYWMNRLQHLATKRDLFVTLNPAQVIADGAEIAAINYTHPVFDTAALTAQRTLWSLQGRRNTWFCGSYFGAGFHEDGLQAGLAAAEDIGGVRRPWTVTQESGRIFILPANGGSVARVAAE